MYQFVFFFSASGVTIGREVIHTKTGITTKQSLSAEVSYSHVVTGAQCGLRW
jgi:hypothetical protein